MIQAGICQQKLKYRRLFSRNMTNETKKTSTVPNENVRVATANGVFVIPKRFLPQVLKGVAEISEEMADGKDPRAS